MANNTRQITLHFTGDNTKILDTFKTRAKANFRTTEQEILFELNGIVSTLSDLDDCPTPAEPTDKEIKDMERFIVGDMTTTDNNEEN